MTLKVSSRGAVPSFIVMDVMRAANQMEVKGEHILHMEVGQPSTGAPNGVVDAVKNILGKEVLGYTDAFGVHPLRQRICDYYQQQHIIDVPLSRVVATVGSSGGFVLAFLASFDVGDKVALASPGYPAYRNILTALGVDVIDIPVGADTNFQPTSDHIEQIVKNTLGGIDGLIIASPSNPTGTMIAPNDLKDLCDVCARHQIRLVSDEIYHGITYGKKASSVLEFTDQAIIVNSFSKYYSMTGWRLGWMVLPDDLVRNVECLAQNLFISPPAVSQYAGLAAFDCRDELDRNVKRYAKNRALLLQELPNAGFDKLASADGAFYIYADVSDLTNDSQLFCARMLSETGVATTPGADFDPSRGHQYMRFSFARAFDDMELAVERLKQWNK